MSNDSKLLNQYDTSRLAATSERTVLHMATIAAENKQDEHIGGKEEEEILELRSLFSKEDRHPNPSLQVTLGSCVSSERGGGGGVGARGGCRGSFSPLQVSEP